MAFLWAEPVWEAWRSQWGARWNQMKDARGIGLLVRSLEQIIWGLAFPWQALMLALQCSLGTLMVSMLFIFALVFVFPIAYSVMRAMEGWEKARIWAGVPGEARFGAGFEAVRLKAEGKISAWVDELAKEGKSGYIEAEEQALRGAALAPRAKGSVSRAQRV